MAQFGRIVLYSSLAPVDQRLTVRRVIDALAAKMVIFAYVDQPLRHTLEYEMEFVESGSLVSRGRPPVWDRQDAIRALELFPSDQTVVLEFGVGPRMARFIEELETQIPAHVRGDFCPWKPILTIGPHDIIEELWSEPNLRLVAHAAVSFEIRGQPTPLDNFEYKRLLLESSAMRSIKSEFENILGPLESWIGWWV